MVLKLNKNEIIARWRIVVETNQDRRMSTDDLGIDLPDNMCAQVDEILADEYPVGWYEND